MTPTLDTVFAALADPTRREILRMLLEDDMAVTDVAEPFEMSLAAISKHLGVLTRAGLVSQEKSGRITWCKLEPHAMRAAWLWMQGFGHVEPVEYDALERLLIAGRLLPEDGETTRGLAQDGAVEDGDVEDGGERAAGGPAEPTVPGRPG